MHKNHLLKRLEIRRYWLVWLTIGYMTLLIMDTTIGWQYPLSNQEWVIYPVLFFRHTLKDFLFMLFSVLPLSLFLIFWMAVVSKPKNWLVTGCLALAILALGVSSYVTGSVQGTTFSHRHSMTFEGRFYHLVDRTWRMRGDDWFNTSILLYECDQANMVCDIIGEFDKAKYTFAFRRNGVDFKVTENTLYVEVREVATVKKFRIKD